jgi:hypothetical protein
MRDGFLKSINIGDDIGHPERLAHYQPTSRSAPLIARVMRPSATMAIASYGSGKSLAAGIGALAVENSPDSASVLMTVAERARDVRPDVAEALEERLASDARGKVAVLSGYVRDLPGQLAEALGLSPARSIRAVIGALRGLSGIDHVAIVWDEFGRHLEGLIKDARSRDLEHLQELAELSVRPSGPTCSLTLLLHQNVLAYAQDLNQTSRNEWRKIEGRFDQMRFVEDSRELYALIGTIVRERQPEIYQLAPAARDEAVARAIEGRWYDGVQDDSEVRKLQEDAWPLSSAVLQVLPRIVARVGQNERSLFTFLDEIDMSAPVAMDMLYAHFFEAFRSDIGIGGLQRQWVEVESARSKTEFPAEREALAATFLLQAGVVGEKRHLKRAVLVGALVGAGYPLDEAEATVASLAERKLLIHRKLNDDVSVWHGADIDVAAKLREEKTRLAPGFDLLSFLAREHPAPAVRALGHNVKFGVARYLDGVYVAARDIADLPPVSTGWGHVAYVIANTAEEIAAARKAAETVPEGIVIVLPQEPVSFAEAALEVEALLSLKGDDKLTGEDPLVIREIDEFLAIARRHLAILMHRLTTDRPSVSEWWHIGRRLEVDADRPAGIAVSAIMDGLYPKTPRIVNDQIVRTRISRQMTTARLRMVTALLARAGQRDIGYAADDGAAEASVYRTVLARTGIYREDGDGGRFALPEEIEDTALSEIWALLREFFTAKGTKTLSSIIQVLGGNPYGVSPAVQPILVMAAYKAFARTVIVRSDGEFVRDLLGFDSTRFFDTPNTVEFEVLAHSQQLTRYLDDFAHTFLYERPGPFDEKVMFAAMALEAWTQTLSDGSRRSNRMPDEARAMLRAIQQATDPARLVVETLPNLLGPPEKPFAAKLTYVLDGLQRCRNAIDGLVQGYLRDAVEVVEDVLHLAGSDKTTVDGVVEWVGCFDVPALLQRQDLKMTDTTVLRTVEETKAGRYSAEGLARVISHVLMRRGVDKWQDDTKEHFRKELREARERIERAALDVERPSKSLLPILEARMMHLQKQMERIRHAGDGEGGAL